MSTFDGRGNVWQFVVFLTDLLSVESIVTDTDRLSYLDTNADRLFSGAALDWFRTTAPFSSFNAFRTQLINFADANTRPTPPPPIAPTPTPSTSTPTHPMPSSSSSSSSAPPKLQWTPPAPFTGFACPNYSHVSLFFFALNNACHLASRMSGFAVDDKTKTYMACACLTGAALVWASHPDVYKTFTSFDTFTTLLTAQFSPIDSNKAARHNLTHCAQTTTVEAYIEAFRAICTSITRLCPEERLTRFLDGLKPAVRLQVAITKPTSFDDAASTALCYERTVATYSAQTPAPPKPPSTSRPPAPSNLSPKPAFLHAVSSTPSTNPRTSRPRAPITPEERADLLSKGGCTYCRQLGHTVDQCTLCPKARPQ
jgi:hypothetical protein